MMVENCADCGGTHIGERMCPFKRKEGNSKLVYNKETRTIDMIKPQQITWSSVYEANLKAGGSEDNAAYEADVAMAEISNANTVKKSAMKLAKRFVDLCFDLERAKAHPAHERRAIAEEAIAASIEEEIRSFIL
jgi:hypothetical protein